MTSSGATNQPATVNQNLEQELRFVPVHRLPRESVTIPTWRGYRVQPLASEYQVNTYLDTPSQRLAQQSITFRRRVREDQAELTLKMPRPQVAGEAQEAHLSAHIEYNQPIGPTTPIEGEPVTIMAQRYAAGEPIASWFTFATRREGVILERNGTSLQMTWDHLTLPNDPDFVDDEIEVELLQGSMDELLQLADQLTGELGLSFGVAGKRSRVGKYLARRGRINYPGVVANEAAEARDWR